MSPESAAFEASYATRCDPAVRPAIEEMKTMDEPSASFGSASRMTADIHGRAAP